ncbi:MAG: NrfD/PsrC family molybdoenzyme membrane anchor subunit [Planctomycetota bacterium]|jgi:molybdopterin-containing oxidoreductase family membrane subunit
METKFEQIEGKSTQYFILLAVLALLAIAGLYSTYRMYVEGIYLSGMTNRVPWGLQVILAVFYIGLSAGSLVISSLYAIFGKKEYKPFARISVFLAFLFLVAALLSIISDWGRPDRIFEPFSNFNPLSMLSINPFLYNVYMLICIVYLWAMFKEKEKFIKVIAPIAVIWAIGVHSGTGAIFGFVPRELYQSALLPPSFIAAALSSGTALMILVLLLLFKVTGRSLDEKLIIRLGKLLAIFIVVVMYFMFVENAYRLYLPVSHEAGMYFLFGGFHSGIFWVGLILLGSVVPAIILFNPGTVKQVPWVVISCILVVFGVLCERYIIVIPGQTHAPELFPNKKVVSSALAEGYVGYSISFYEVLQALGVVGIIGFAFVLGLKLFRMMPTEAKDREQTESVEPPFEEKKPEKQLEKQPV